MCDVLVVDDHEFVRAMLVEFLEDAGFCVIDSSGPGEALAVSHMLDAGGVLVTDLDFGLSAMDGFTLVTQIRLTVPQMRVVFVSGRADNFKDRLYGDNERTLAKPFDGPELVAVVRDLMAA